MSRVMYNYRIDKSRWWELSRAVKQAYLEKHPAPELIRTLTPNDGADTETSVSRIVRLTEVVDILVESNMLVDLQLFDEGETYLIRPLEKGWFFLNNAQRWADEFGLEMVFYDDRSDVSPDDVRNREASVWTDKKIEDGEYLIFPVVTRDTLHQLGLDRLLFGKVDS